MGVDADRPIGDARGESDMEPKHTSQPTTIELTDVSESWLTLEPLPWETSTSPRLLEVLQTLNEVFDISQRGEESVTRRDRF